ncbi:MlaE family lipid ABC transporter permease subunit [Candidatus Sulfurimonas marisnigri]|uniref:MlaE family lipid ABC transporter permease subunit n=1 Tax=Candidatus Sulfurimonas marisnigri TaxID=2740405 RepID=A0A7S7RQ39_9BACT|nr:MlaE family lipid ABC transporter permease subunit [Candidatus Sulfurimonas marisnigri]QOY54148.1 MlaE family lipid ABC transporter permease subunit [Candidatus Sulfurimonas marisnigri]
MYHSSFEIEHADSRLSLRFIGELTLYNISKCQKQISSIDLNGVETVDIDFLNLSFLDSAASIFIYNLQTELSSKNIQNNLLCNNREILEILELIKYQKQNTTEIPLIKDISIIEKIGFQIYKSYKGVLLFMAFMGELFANILYYFFSVKNIRYKEIAFEINESAIKAVGIVAITSFLIGIVVAYQSAFQLKLFGANVFIVDILGLSILREISPLITAIVIAGRSGSAFTAQIGAMKITEELDAMRTMGFDPYKFLVLPRVIALMIAMPILIFLSDVMAILGGMFVANVDLDITVNLFLDRFSDVIAVKHFFIGIVKGPFFAFFIATIGLYRGLMVKNDTQSIGFNTTKSVVESIFAVIICDAVFSIAFTNLGI